MLKRYTNFYPLLETGGLIAFHDAYPGMPSNGVFQAIIEFSSKHPGMHAIIPPASSPRVWENLNGSISIYRKTT